MHLERISLVCDDLTQAAAFWQDVFGLSGRLGTDPVNPERQVLRIAAGGEDFLEYVWFPGQPGDRGSGDLRRIDLVVGPAVRDRLVALIGAGPVDRLPDGRLAVLERQTGLLIVCRVPDGGRLDDENLGPSC
jgi:catechol 2,3-dioxygenase-like lactoylglutathione lyase family enzyme